MTGLNGDRSPLFRLARRSTSVLGPGVESECVDSGKRVGLLISSMNPVLQSGQNEGESCRLTGKLMNRLHL